MQNFRPVIYFYDFTFLLPFQGKNIKTKLKIPAFSVFQALYYCEYILEYDIRLILEIRKYTSSVTRGNVRVDYKLQSTIDEVSIGKWLRAYKLRKNSINSVKFKIDSLL